MRTYKLFATLLVCTLLGCSKTDQDQGTTEETGSGIDADYTMVLAQNGQWSGTIFNANLKSISLSSDTSSFSSTEEPLLTYRDGISFSLFNKKTECKGEIISYDFGKGQKATNTVFEDLGICNLTPKALAHSDSQLFVGYGLWNEVDLKNDYYIRIIDRKTNAIKDIPLDKEPLEFALSNNRLFVLCLDAKGTGNHSLIIVDINSEEQVHELTLGLEAQKIAKDSDGNILVSYTSMYVIIDSATLKSISEVRYIAGKDPKFGTLNDGLFNDGKLYYRRPKETTGSIPQIPAVYDFKGKVASYYYYENFLTSEELLFEYNIEDTSMVSYDAKNNLILIGYRKKGDTELGGLLRIKPAPEPKFIDNTDLDGVPYAVFVK